MNSSVNDQRVMRCQEIEKVGWRSGDGSCLTQLRMAEGLSGMMKTLPWTGSGPEAFATRQDRRRLLWSSSSCFRRQWRSCVSLIHEVMQ